MTSVKRLPRSGPEREELREKGQFWTPDWVADAMVSYVAPMASVPIFDPAVGAGAFLSAAKRLAAELKVRAELSGTEIYASALEDAQRHGLSNEDLADVEVRDFVLNPPSLKLKAIVANPPYIRHHRLTQETKSRLRTFCASFTGLILDARAGYHVYFLLRALQMLAPEGRLAFIMPADTVEGKFAPILWKWISSHYCLDAVVTFSPEASPFPGVDTNAIIFLIRNAPPVDRFHWVRVTRADTSSLKEWICKSFWPGFSVSGGIPPDIDEFERTIEEGLRTGLSRQPETQDSPSVPLSRFAYVVRGIATGANEFFFLTREKARSLGIPTEFLIPAIGRTRDVDSEIGEITLERLEQLDAQGRPTVLFSADARGIEEFPQSVQDYLKEGDTLGLPTRPLIASRRPWYKMERRVPPPFLFAYLGRRNARFIRNTASVVPLTGFLCVYARRDDTVFKEKLWRVLSHPLTVANLAKVGKSYGHGAIKVEPRALESLPIPLEVLDESGLVVNGHNDRTDSDLSLPLPL